LMPVKQSNNANNEINCFIIVSLSISDCKIRLYLTHYLARLAIEGFKLISAGFLPISDWEYYLTITNFLFITELPFILIV